MLGPSGRGAGGAEKKGASLWSNAPSITKVRGGVKEGGPTMREGQPHRGKLRARGGSGSVESTSVRRKALLFAGRRWKRTLADSSEEGRSLQPPRPNGPATRVLEGEMPRGGELATGERLRSGALGPCGATRKRSVARLVTAIG